MGDTIVRMYRGENGFIIQLTPKQGGSNRGLTDFLAADTVIDLKNSPNGTTALQLTSSDFAFNDPSIDWTVTDTHLSSLPGKRYQGYIHLKHNSNSIEEISTFSLVIVEV